MAKKIFIIRLRLAAASAVFEAPRRAMWISDYRLVYFSALPLRVTLADKMGLTKFVTANEDVLPESSAMPSRQALSYRHVTFRTRVRAANDRSIRGMTGSRRALFIGGACERWLDAPQLSIRAGHRRTRCVTGRPSIVSRVDGNRVRPRAALRSRPDGDGATGGGRLMSRDCE